MQIKVTLLKIRKLITKQFDSPHILIDLFQQKIFTISFFQIIQPHIDSNHSTS